MKISTLILTLLAVCLIATLTFYLGRIFERTAAMQTEMGELKDRISGLEQINTRREQNLKWFKRIGSRLPLIGRLVGRE